MAQIKCCNKETFIDQREYPVTLKWRLKKFGDAERILNQFLTEENKNVFKYFFRKFDTFTNYRYRIAIKWLIRKLKSLFKVKSKNLHPFNVINSSKYSCGEENIEEIERNAENFEENTKTQHKKLNQQDTCQVTSITCLHGKLRCLL